MKRCATEIKLYLCTGACVSAQTFWGSGRKGTAGRGEMRDSTGTGVLNKGHCYI